MILSRSDDLIRKLIAEGRQATDEEDAVDAIRQAGQMLAEIGDEDVEYLVHRRVAEQDAVVTYRANPPRCEMHIKETA